MSFYMLTLKSNKLRPGHCMRISSRIQGLCRQQTFQFIIHRTGKEIKASKEKESGGKEQELKGKRDAKVFPKALVSEMSDRVALTISPGLDLMLKGSTTKEYQIPGTEPDSKI